MSKQLETMLVQRGVMTGLICPVTRQRLVPGSDGASLVTEDGTRRYPVVHGRVPVVLRDPDASAKYAASSSRMSSEYTPEALARQRSPWRRFKARLIQDYRSAKSVAAFDRVFADPRGRHLAIGGGPSRAHPTHINLNIAAFPNVDIVADAHELPYEDATMDAIYVEAVLEHLQRPGDAVAEMFRVLRPGGRVWASTPFMQAYHGYPDHYQNYTVTGHQLLFERAGFVVEEAGAHVGPMFTMVSLTATFLRTYLPGGRVLSFLWGGVGAALRPLDILLHKHNDAYVLASTTYVVARR